MDIIDKIFNFLEKLIEFIGIILLVGMVIVIGGQIFCRYFLNFTPKWSEDIALIFMVWFSFLGIAIGVKRGIHLSIEFFINILSNKGKFLIILLDHALTTLFGYILLTRGYLLAKMTVHSKISSLGVPTATLYGVVPITGFFIMCFSILKILDMIVKSSERKRDLNDKKVEEGV